MLINSPAQTTLEAPTCNLPRPLFAAFALLFSSPPESASFRGSRPGNQAAKAATGDGASLILGGFERDSLLTVYAFPRSLPRSGPSTTSILVALTNGDCFSNQKLTPKHSPVSWAPKPSQLWEVDWRPTH